MVRVQGMYLMVLARRTMPRRKKPRRPSENGAKHWIMLWLGWGFIALGLVGLFLPVLQGFLFLAVGTVILSSRSPRVRLLILKLGQRYPRFRAALIEARERVRKLRRRITRRGAKAH